MRTQISRYPSIVLLTAAFLISLIDPLSADSQTTLRRNGKIAFTSGRDGNREIYVMNPDGSSQVRLTTNSLIDDHATWSPDGKTIAFLSQRPTGQFAIFRMNSDGTGKTEITPAVYTPEQTWRGFDGWNLSWSPDGSHIAFTDMTTPWTLVVVRADGTNRQTLATGFGPAWSPNGAKIIFLRAGSPNTFYNLYTIRPDGSDLQFVPTSFPEFGILWDSPPAWSPDGRQLALHAFDGANSSIFITNADATSPSLFTMGCAAVVPEGCSSTSLATWSPNGKTLAFANWGVTSETEIYVKDIGGLEELQLTNSANNNSHPSWQRVAKAMADFDGDGRSDFSVFRPSDGVWYLNRSTDGFTATPFGVATDILAPGDYDGDSKTDIALFRTGTWWMVRSSDSTVRAYEFGREGDQPVPADFTGDGQNELAVYRNGDWWALDLTNGQSSLVSWGLASDKPTAGDFDGDGRTDPAVYRDGVWYALRSTQGPLVAQFGVASDTPVAADYDGDAKTDVAVFRSGTWYLQQTSAGFNAFQFGTGTDVPVPADYDGDGKTDAAIFRDGQWWIRQTTGGVSALQFGLSGDKPLPGAFVN